MLLRPVDVDGHTLKAAGSVRIEAYDLDARDVRLGRWEFPAADIKRHWNSVGMIHEYVFTLPWDREPPEEAKLLLRATFVDALTGRSFEALREIR